MLIKLLLQRRSLATPTSENHVQLRLDDQRMVGKTAYGLGAKSTS